MNGRPRHWGSLADLNGSCGAGEAMSQELRAPADADAELPSRRDFLKLLGAGAAFAAAGCARKPVEKILPYIKAPEEITPGNAVYYASTCGECPASCGLLIKTREGRPIKLEGNRSHPVSRGGLCARGQASLLNLYDPDRLKAPAKVKRDTGEVSDATWGEIDKRAAKTLKKAVEQGKAVVLLSGTITSPSTRALIQSFLSSFPSGEHVIYDALSMESVLKAQELCYGERVNPRLRFDRAEVLLSIGADFLGAMHSPIEHARDFAHRRRPESGGMSRFIMIESMLSLAGTNADRRIRVRPEQFYPVTMAIANEIVVGRGSVGFAGRQEIVAAVSAYPAADVEREAGLGPGTLSAVAGELWDARGRSLVLAGSQAAPAAHSVALQSAVNLINSALGNEGVTVEGTTPSYQSSGSDEAMLRLVERMAAGEVHALLVQGTNPAYTLPAAVGFAEAVKRVPFVASFGDRVDETGRLASVIAPDTHYLESWNDHEPQRGVLSLTQPAVAPLYDLRSFQDTLLAWARFVGRGPLAVTTGSWHEHLKERWRTEVYPNADAAAPFEIFWEGVLREGVHARPGSPAAPRTFSVSAFAARPEAIPMRDDSLSLVLYAPTSLYDGRSANNAWLQELPDPVSKVCWDNYVALSPSRAKALGVGTYEMKADVVTIDAGHAKLDLPVVVQPGLHDDVAAVALGYGRTAAGRVGDHVGRNAFALAESTGGRISLSAIRVRIAPAGRRERLALVQGHQTTENRPIICETSWAEYARDHRAGNEGHHGLPSMWTRHKFEGHRWGMGIDLTACIGCSACMIGCQAENNVPSVGKQIVLQGREMHWIRVDRYYSGPEAEPEVTHQPMPCQHCENAPCETVCPVLATVHSSEGLNIQVYNRCVGTRFCSNNCPYKVRRFNWFDYPHKTEKSLRLVLNPDVTTRTKGVMEKCTFCVQRIRDGKERAKALGVPVRDGEIETACQQSCPTDAIVFGDLNDPNSRVTQMSKNERGYHVLAELNTLPAVTYQVKVRNREETGA